MMRTYGIETKGVIIEVEEFRKLLFDNKQNILNKFELTDEWQEIFDDMENEDDIEYETIYDFIYNIDCAFYVVDFEGYLDNDLTQERTYFNDDSVIILELKKDDLYNKYTDRDEGITELQETLGAVGIIVDNNYINEHFGYINGSYVA